MVEYKPHVSLFVRLSAGLAILIFFAIIFVSGPEISITYIGVIATLVSAIWWFFNTFLWRCWPIKSFLGVPDLNGRWCGVIDRVGENDPHDFVLEVRQTLLKIRCSTYTRNGTSNSIVASLCCEDGRDPFTLFFIWIGQTSGTASGQKTRAGLFYGTTILKVERSGSIVDTLAGEYFTNRYPRQTRGTVNVKYLCSTLAHKFE